MDEFDVKEASERLGLRAEVYEFEIILGEEKRKFGSERTSEFEQRLNEIKSEMDSARGIELSTLAEKIKILKNQFVIIALFPRKKVYVSKIWLFALLWGIFVHLLIGERTLFKWLDESQFMPSLTGPLVGHFIGYLQIRYIIYGALMGTATILTYKNLKMEFRSYQEAQNLLSAPVVNFVMTCAVSYTFFRLIIEGLVSFSIFGLDISNKSVGGGVIFLATFAISLTVERYIAKLITMAEPAANR